MTRKNGTNGGTPTMTVAAGTFTRTQVSKLFGRCVTIRIGAQCWEVKVMGERTSASLARQQFINALVAAGAEEVVAEPTTTKGDD